MTAGPDEARWRERVRAMLGRHRDPRVHEDVWDYLEGKIDRRELVARPGFRAAYAAELRARAEEAGESGALARLQEAFGAATERSDADRVREENVEEVLAALPEEYRAFAERALTRPRRL